MNSSVSCKCALAVKSFASLAARATLFLLLCEIAVAIGPSGTQAAGAGMMKTKVTTYEPAVPRGPAISGWCWSRSIAVNRRGTWRCMEGNRIYDPCFSVAALKQAVVCDANPAADRPGFVLKLTRPLPAAERAPFHPQPWLIRLSDGSTCQALTGTLAFVAGQVIRYGCSDSSGCSHGDCPRMAGVSTLSRGAVWRARKMIYAVDRKGVHLIERREVPVVAVWR